MHAAPEGPEKGRGRREATLPLYTYISTYTFFYHKPAAEFATFWVVVVAPYEELLVECF